MAFIKIKILEDMKKVSHQILEKVVKGNICYFNLIVCELDMASSAFFTPTAPIRGENKRFLGVDDYEKLIMLLLSNPNCKDLAYNPKENCIIANFFNPFSEELRKMEEKEHGYL